MVRILKVTELAARKKELLARSEIHRQTLALEVTNVKLGLTLLKKRMRVLKTAYKLFGWAVPVGGLLFGRKRRERKSGFMTKLLSGFNLVGRIRSFLGGHKAEEQMEAEDSPRF